MWHVAETRLEDEIKFGGEVNCMAVGALGTRLAVAGKPAHVVIYALVLPPPHLAAEGVAASITEITRLAPAGTVSLALSADATLLCTGGEQKIVQLWSLHDLPTHDVSAKGVAEGAAPTAALSGRPPLPPSAVPPPSTRSPSPPLAIISPSACRTAPRSIT